MICGTDEVSKETLTQWQEAAQYGICIIEGSRCRGVYTPCLPAIECSRITHIVGHAHITGPDASRMRRLQQLQHAKLWQINHVMPRAVDILKEDGTAQSREESARKKEAILKALNEEADYVFSVGDMMYDHFEQQLCKVGRNPGTKHASLILPLNPDFLKSPTTTTDFSANVIQVMFFGRTDSTYYVKGVDIAQRAVETANAKVSRSGKTIKLTVLGAKPSMEAETVRKLIALQQEKYRDVSPCVEGFASPAEVLSYLQRTHIVIMTSRNEPFGLVAMEAIACEVPVLVSSNSGVARLLEKHDVEQYLVVQTSLHHPDDTSSKAQQADIDAWSEAILGLIAEDGKAFYRAKKLSGTLQKKLDSPYPFMIALGSGP
ncbi:glycosyltransferase [archaeon]|nr:MAG: glycosyltransferase [archaeon]